MKEIITILAIGHGPIFAKTRLCSINSGTTVCELNTERPILNDLICARSAETASSPVTIQE